MTNYLFELFLLLDKIKHAKVQNMIYKVVYKVFLMYNEFMEKTFLEWFETFFFLGDQLK